MVGGTCKDGSGACAQCLSMMSCVVVRQSKDAIPMSPVDPNVTDVRHATAARTRGRRRQR